MRDALLTAGVSDDQAEVVLLNMAKTKDDPAPVEGYVLPVAQRTVVVQQTACRALGIYTSCCQHHVLNPVCMAKLATGAQLSQDDISDFQRILNTQYFWIFWMQVASWFFLLATILFGIRFSTTENVSDTTENVMRVAWSFFLVLRIGTNCLRCWAHPAICEKLEQRFSSRGMSFEIVPRFRINFVPVAWRLVVSYQTTTTTTTEVWEGLLCGWLQWLQCLVHVTAALEDVETSSPCRNHMNSQEVLVASILHEVVLLWRVLCGFSVSTAALRAKKGRGRDSVPLETTFFSFFNCSSHRVDFRTGCGEEPWTVWATVGLGKREGEGQEKEWEERGLVTESLRKKIGRWDSQVKGFCFRFFAFTGKCPEGFLIVLVGEGLRILGGCLFDRAALCINFFRYVISNRTFVHQQISSLDLLKQGDWRFLTASETSPRNPPPFCWWTQTHQDLSMRKRKPAEEVHNDHNASIWRVTILVLKKKDLCQTKSWGGFLNLNT